MAVTGWSTVATFSSGFEADLAIAQLEAGDEARAVLSADLETDR